MANVLRCYKQMDKEITFVFLWNKENNNLDIQFGCSFFTDIIFPESSTKQ